MLVIGSHFAVNVRSDGGLLKKVATKLTAKRVTAENAKIAEYGSHSHAAVTIS
jgi:hypothetical protein